MIILLYKYSADRQTMSLFRYPASKEGINYTTLSNVTEVAAYAFDNAQYLHNVTINAKNVLKFAFKKSTINNLTIGSAVESIAKDAFRDCYMLETVVSNSSEYKIEDGGIYNANKTELIKYFGKTLNKTYNSIATLTTINDYAFDGCSNIVSIMLGPNVRYINAMAFSDCSNLTTLKLEAPQVTIYNANVINKCSSLETIYCYTTSTNPGYNILLAAPEVTEFSIQFIQI